jgi:signal peptidase I
MRTYRKLLIASSIVPAFGGLVLATCLVIFVRAIRVPTGSMANTIVPGDHLIVIKRVGQIGRGDIVIFTYPRDQSIQYISRVIGLPRETIEIRDRSVLINGNELQEHKVTVKPDLEATAARLEELSSEGSGPYRVFYWERDVTTAGQLLNDSSEAVFGIAKPFQIPDDQYFVMGDNRDNSYDSRFYGPVARQLISAKPTVIYWSDHSERIFKRVH